MSPTLPPAADDAQARAYMSGLQDRVRQMTSSSVPAGFAARLVLGSEPGDPGAPHVAMALAEAIR
jgi:hypothetical protein